MQHCSWSVPSEKGGGEFLNSGKVYFSARMPVFTSWDGSSIGVLGLLAFDPASAHAEISHQKISLSTRGVTDNRTYIPHQYLTSRRYGNRIIRTKFGKSSVRYIGP